LHFLLQPPSFFEEFSLLQLEVGVFIFSLEQQELEPHANNLKGVKKKLINRISM
jgi:hypothetical protein